MKTSFVYATRRVYFSLFVIFVSLLALIIMAESVGKESPTKVYIIFTENPKNEDPKAFYLRTLSSALGCEQAAKDALVYTYSNVGTGFSAKLTPEQVTNISKLPGVISVTPSKIYHTHDKLI